MATKERITGGQSSVSITGANAAGSANLPAGIFGSLDTWGINPKFTYETHNEVNNPRSVRQQTDQMVTVTITGGVTDDTALHLAARQSAGFLNAGQTPKYHIRIHGDGSDGSMDRIAQFCTLDDANVQSPAGNKTVTKSLTFQAEDIV